MLGDLVLVDDASGARPDLAGVGVAEAAARPGGHRLDLVEFGLGLGQQLAAFTGPFGGDRGVTADNEALTREQRRTDLGQVCLIKQRLLQVARGHQRTDLLRLQRADEVDALLFEGDRVRLGDHAAVTDEHDLLDPEALPDGRDRLKRRLLILRGAVVDATPTGRPSGEQISP